MLLRQQFCLHNNLIDGLFVRDQRRDKEVITILTSSPDDIAGRTLWVCRLSAPRRLLQGF